MKFSFPQINQEIVDKINNKNELLIPYLRRKELSTDKSLVIDTIFDCLMYYKKLNVCRKNYSFTTYISIYNC